MEPLARRPSRLAGILGLRLLADRFPALHGLRVLAILSVLQIHVTLMMHRAGLPLGRAFADYSTRIFFGMDLFFILSGFLIGTMLMYSVDQRSSKGFLRFYARRAFRTFPTYYVVLTLLALSRPLGPVQRSNLVWEYAYLTNYLHGSIDGMVMNWGWSLCVEEHFYLIVPVLMAGLFLFRSHRVRVGLLVALWLACLGVRLGIYIDASHPWTGLAIHRALYRPTHARFDILVAGILVAYVHRYWGEKISRLLRRGEIRALFLAATLLGLGALLSPDPTVSRSPLFSVFAWGTITSLMYVPLILFLLCGDGPLHRFLSMPFFLKAATLGYGIYLVHIPVCGVIAMAYKPLQALLPWPPLLLWLQILCWLILGSAVAAYLLHLLVEKPMLWLRDRLAP